MIFLQAYSYDQLDMRQSFLQKCHLQQFFEDIAPEKIQSDLNTIKKCLKLIQDAASDTTKIVEQIDILEGVSIVQSMIKVSADFGLASDFGYFVALTICIYILFIYLLYVQSR